MHINVWKNAELSVDVRVRPDGTITMPLVGDIKAAGRTPSSLKAEISKRLQSFVRDEGAIVSVAVTEVNSYRFTVAGQVEHAGLMNAKYYVTASEAIAMAGGLNRYANPHRVTLVRNDPHGLRRIPLDYERIASGAHPEEDVVILAGDTLFAE
jgi:polysaccharide export outer membrane protein